MGMVDVAANLFTGQEGFEELDNIVKLKESRKRGKYNKEVKTNNRYQFLLILSQLINPYTYLQEILKTIAIQYVPMPFLSKEETAFEYYGLTVWYSVYDSATYTYFDTTTGITEICNDEEFQIFEAELIGTETMLISDRLALHTKLLVYLDEGVSLEYAVNLVKPEIERIKRIYEETKAYAMAENQSRIFTRV